MDAADIVSETGGEKGEVPSLALPVPAKRRGEATRRRLRRTALAYLSLAVAGLMPSIARRSTRARVVGYGLIIPGGGFFATARPAKGLVSFVTTVAGGVLMFVTGNVIAAPLAWISSAAAAGRGSRELGRAARWAVPASVIAAAAAAAIADRRGFARIKANVDKRNAYLTVCPRSALKPAAQAAVGPAMSELEVGLTRHVIDLALQPLDRWDGFVKIDQFREAAYRYQLTTPQWALAVAQMSRTPACTGVMSEAQNRLIRKHEQPVVWRYWFWENLWGNLSLNPDPVRRKNIMLSGWLATSLGLYEGVTGDLSYDAPGALSFHRKGRGSAYGYDEICQALTTDLKRSHFGLSDCEPGWTFNICNVFVGLGLLMHDRIHGTNYWESVEERFMRGLSRDFTTPDGRTVVFRSSRLGFPIAPVNLLSDAQSCVLIRPLDRTLAERMWTMCREEFIRVVDGRLRIATTAMDFTDAGNYQRNSVGLYGGVIAAAREFGDDTVAALAEEALLAEISPEWSNGAARFPGVSNLNHALLLRGLVSTKDSWYHAVIKGLDTGSPRGPYIADASYPDMFVTHAVNDGEVLRCVVSVDYSRGHQATLRIAGLAASRQYLVEETGEVLKASSDGCAAVAISNGGAHVLTIRPTI